MTKAIEIIKDIIEAYLWYDGEVYPIVNNTDQISYVKTGVRMGVGDWLKLVSTWVYNGYTVTLNPTAVDAIVVNAPVSEEIVVDYYNDATNGSTRTAIAAALQSSDYFTTASATNGTTKPIDDDDSKVLAGGKFFVKRKEGGHIALGVDQAELYNIKLESDTEENTKKMVSNLRLLNNNIYAYSYKYETAGYPFSLKFGNADDKQNQGNNDFIITISLDARSTL